MEREYEALRDFFHGLDYSNFVYSSTADQLRAVASGVDYVFNQDDGRQRFMNMVSSLSKALALRCPERRLKVSGTHLPIFNRYELRSANGSPTPTTRYSRILLPLYGRSSRELLHRTASSIYFEIAGLAGANVGIFF